jgi:uncharacterized membrane protein YgdD (TMEM256/DUF423 family)
MDGETTERISFMQRLWIVAGAASGLVTVAMAAMAAHAIADPVSREIAGRGVQMNGWHALALIATGLWAPRGGTLADAAGVAFAAGTLAFCAAIYSLALGGVSLGALAPVGGGLAMLGWLLLALSALRPRR